MYPLSAGLVIADKNLGEQVQACLRELRVRVVLEQAAISRWGEFLLQLERAQPEVLIFDLSQPRLEEIISRIRTISPAPVVVVHHTADAETILGAVRAGAKEYVYPPLGPGLQKALERLAADSRVRQEAAKETSGSILGFLSAKGGCGATTIACHLAVELQRVTQKEILLSDLDMSAGVIGFLMKAGASYSILDAVQNLSRLDLSYWKALVSNGYPRLEVITSPPEPLVDRPLEPEPFREVLRFVRANYDWVVTDLGRGLSLFALGLLDEIDELFVVTHLEVPALYQTKNIIQSMRETGYSEHRLHVIVNRVPKQSDFSTEEVERMLGLKIHTKLPNGYTDLYEAYAEGRLLSPESQLGKHFTRLAMSITGVREDKGGRGFSLFGVKKVAPEWGGL